MISSKSIIIDRQSFIYNNNIDVDINIKTSDNFPVDYINKEYKNLLNDIKNEVCNYENWYIYRKLFTTSLFLNYYHNKKNIGIFKKCKRRYFKIIEIQMIILYLK